MRALVYGFSICSMARKRSPHPGIVVLKPQPATHRPALIRWRDPASGKFKTEKLPELPPADLRKWLRKRSYELEGQRLANPRPQKGTGMPPTTAVERYFDEVRLRDSTAHAYARSTARLLEWPELPSSLADMTLEKLRGLRTFLNRPSMAPQSVNFHLRQLAAVFEHSRLAGRTPQLSAQDIHDGLSTFRSAPEKKQPLSVPQLRELVLALNRFIGEAQSDVGAEAPALFRAYVLTLLLSGMRPGEGLALSTMNLAPDHIWLTGAQTKTHKARRIAFDVSPTLPRLFEALPSSGMANSLFGLNENQTHYMRTKIQVTFDWTFQQLRVTCGSYLACSNIYGGASAYMAASRLGHSVQISERHYLGVVEVNREARILEHAYGIADLL